MSAREKENAAPGRRELLALAAIVLLATILRVGWPTLTEFKFSEARLAALAMELTREGRVSLIGVPSSAGFDHSPLSVYLYVPAFLPTTNPILATIYGGLIGAAAVVLTWWLARRWPGGGMWAALITGLLFATSPWAVAFSRKIWQVVFVLALAPGFVGLVVSALVKRRHWNLAWAIVAYALLVQIHPSAVSLLPAILLWTIVFWRELRPGPVLAGIGLGILTGVPFLIHQIQNGWPAISALGSLSAPIWDLATVRLTWEAITGRGIHALAGDAYPLLKIVPQLGWFFNIVGWLTVGAALWLAYRAVIRWRAKRELSRQATRVDLILLSWLVVPILFNVRHALDLHLHFYALVVPAAYLIVGRAVQDLLVVPGTVRRGKVLRAIPVTGIGLLALAQVLALVLMGQFVANYQTIGGFGTPLSHYLNAANKALTLVEEEGASEVLVVGQGDSIVVDNLPAIFDALLRGRVSYRFVDGETAALFPPHRAVAIVDSEGGAATDWYAPWPGMEIRSPYGDYRLVIMDGSWPQEGMTIIEGARLFKNGIESQAYRWQGTATPGEQAILWLLWQVLWQDKQDTHFFAQVQDTEGHPWGQYDTVGYPTASRRIGDRIITIFDITVDPEAPAGPYGGRVGQYQYPEVINVPVVDGAGNPVSDMIVVGP